MCGRFQLSVKGKEISERFNVEVFDEKYSPNFNCAPSQNLPVITKAAPGVLSFYRWGLVPSWAKDLNSDFNLINIRAETIRQKPLFKKVFEQQRCLIPANGFYEWRTSDKVPFRFFLRDEPLFSMAGIWDTWKDNRNTMVHTFSIITTRANGKMSNIHHRMPVILSREKEQDSLNSSDSSFLLNLLQPFDDKKMEMHRISKKVNSPKNNGAEIIKPEKGGEQLGLF